MKVNKYKQNCKNTSQSATKHQSAIIFFKQKQFANEAWIIYSYLSSLKRWMKKTNSVSWKLTSVFTIQQCSIKQHWPLMPPPQEYKCSHVNSIKKNLDDGAILYSFIIHYTEIHITGSAVLYKPWKWKIETSMISMLNTVFQDLTTARAIKILCKSILQLLSQTLIVTKMFIITAPLEDVILKGVTQTT